MLVLKRKNGQWLNMKITRETLQRLLDSNQEPEINIRVYDIVSEGNNNGRVNLAFDDPERNFEIQRPERAAKMKAQIIDGVI